MIEMTKEEIEYWNERASEPLRFEPCPKEISEAYNKTHPLPTEEELEEIFRRYKA